MGIREVGKNGEIKGSGMPQSWLDILKSEVQLLPAGETPKQWIDEIERNMMKLQMYMGLIPLDVHKSIGEAGIKLSLIHEAVTESALLKEMETAKESV